jgi:4-amino-4-deoxy-L-arabinose transferase-like glycosyltransferase
MNRKIVIIITLLTAITALLLRIYRVDQIPPHLSNDEISIAYDAYSIARTGMDEHGQWLPISFISNGTYKAPLYAYVLAPLTLVLPQDELTAKIPSILAGVLTVSVIGLLAYELTQSTTAALLASLVLAISPWHIAASRMVLEANLSLFFIAIGIWLILRTVNRNNYALVHWIPVCLFLVISMYGYHTEWVLVPLIILAICRFYLARKPRLLMIFVILATILALPLGLDYLGRIGTHARANSEILWKDPQIAAELFQQSNLAIKAVIVSKYFLDNYFEYTNPIHLFFDGERLFPASNPYQVGLWLWPMVIAAGLGLARLQSSIKSRHWHFFVFWTIVSPVVPALTLGGLNITRNLVTIIPYTIIIAVGVKEILKSKIVLRLPWLILTLASLYFSFMIYLVHYPLVTAASYQGYKPIAQYLKSHDQNAPQVQVDVLFGNNVTYVGVPYLYLGYYNQWDPKVIQQLQSGSAGPFVSKYVFSQIDWNNVNIKKNNLYVVSVGNPPVASVLPKIELVKEVIDVSGMPAFTIWQGI